MATNQALKIADLPDSDGLKYPIPYTIRVSLEVKRKLQEIKARGKDPARTVRKILEEGLKLIED